MRAILLLSAVIILSTSFLTFAGPDDEAYFRQFLFRKVNLEKDQDFPPRYRYYSIAHDMPFEIAYPNGDKLTVLFNLYLNEDGTWDAMYTDFIKPAGYREGDSLAIRTCSVTRGTWLVPDKELVIVNEAGETIYNGERSIVWGKNAVKFRFTDAFPISELRGVAHNFVTNQSDNPPWLRCFPTSI